MNKLNIQQSLRQDGIDMPKRDITFGLTSNVYKNRAIFKKMQSNAAGTFNFPKVEAEALNLNDGDVVDFAAVKLDTKDAFTFQGIEVRKDSRGFFGFTFPESLAEQRAIPRDNLAPIQFVASKRFGTNFNPAQQIRGRRRVPGLASEDIALWKQRVKTSDGGKPYVTIEPNEREFFGLENGDKIKLIAIPISNLSITDRLPLTRFTDVVLNSTVVSIGDGGSYRIYIDRLISALQISEGTIVQCIGVPQ